MWNVYARRFRIEYCVPRPDALLDEAVELIRQLNRQLDFIITSCRHYDAGRHDEAIRIAQATRVLFHETKKSRSLVRSLLNRPDIKLRSTVTLPSAANYHAFGFLGMEVNTGRFRPFLDNSPRSEEVAVSDWWTSETILRSLDDKRLSVTRRELVLDAANTDGGAHVDVARSAKYEMLIRGLGLSIGVRWRSGVRTTVLFRNAHLAALRQIGHEIITSPELNRLARSTSFDDPASRL